MLDKVKKYSIILAIAILFTTFSFSVVDMVQESPEYNNYCDSEYGLIKPRVNGVDNETGCPDYTEPTDIELDECRAQNGVMEYKYDSEGCITSHYCSTCYNDFEMANKNHRLIGFIITSVMAVLAIIIGMYVNSKSEVAESLFSGLLVGGIITLFIGTISYFHDMGRFVKPFVLLAEIGIIIWVAIKTSQRNKKKK